MYIYFNTYDNIIHIINYKMVIKKYISSRKKTKTKTKKSKESLRVSSFSAISNCSNISGGGKISKSRKRQMKSRKSKLKKYRLRKSLHFPGDMIYVMQEVPGDSKSSQEV